MNNHRFKYIFDKPGEKYFVIQDSLQTEFVNGSVYSISRIIWSSCDSYFLVIKEEKDKEILKVGDTLNVRILSIKKDTVIYIASALGLQYQSKVLKMGYR